MFSFLLRYLFKDTWSDVLSQALPDCSNGGPDKPSAQDLSKTTTDNFLDQPYLLTPKLAMSNQMRTFRQQVDQLIGDNKTFIYDKPKFVDPSKVASLEFSDLLQSEADVNNAFWMNALVPCFQYLSGVVFRENLRRSEENRMIEEKNKRIKAGGEPAKLHGKLGLGIRSQVTVKSELEHHQHKHNVKIPFDPPLNLRDLEPSHFVQGWVRTAVDAHTTRKLYFRALCSFEWKVCGVFCKNVDKWTTFAAESAVARNPLPGQRGAIPLSGLSVEGQDKAIHNVLPQARS